MANFFFFKRKAAQNAVAAAEFNEVRRLKVNAANVQTSEVFTGSGLDDMTPAGTYTGIRGIIYKTVITTAAGTDKFDWYKDNVLQAADVSMTGSPQTLDLGVTVDFAATTGHTLLDQWEFEATITSDRYKITNENIASLRMSLDQKVWYHWLYSATEPATNPITTAATADGDGVQSQILPAGNGITMRVPWGLLPSKNTGNLYLFIQKHTNDALMQIAEL